MIINISKLKAGRRPAQRTMDRLARSDIPEERIECDHEYNVIAGHEQYWRLIAKKWPTADVITPVDRDLMEKDKIQKFKDQEVSDLNTEITDLQNKITELIKRKVALSPVFDQLANQMRTIGVSYDGFHRMQALLKMYECGHYPKNHGQPWSSADISKLGLAIYHDLNIIALANNLGRTPFALLCKAIQQGMLNDSNAYTFMKKIVC